MAEQHDTITSQQIDGWRTICTCGWYYANTSPALTHRAGEIHAARYRPQPVSTAPHDDTLPLGY
jgi:hypothetical protein